MNGETYLQADKTGSLQKSHNVVKVWRTCNSKSHAETFDHPVEDISGSLIDRSQVLDARYFSAALYGIDASFC